MNKVFTGVAMGLMIAVLIVVPFYPNQQEEKPLTCEEKAYELVEECMNETGRGEHPAECLQLTDSLMLHCHSMRRDG